MNPYNFLKKHHNRCTLVPLSVLAWQCMAGTPKRATHVDDECIRVRARAGLHVAQRHSFHPPGWPVNGGQHVHLAIRRRGLTRNCANRIFWSTLIKKKIKFSPYVRKLRMEQLQSHIWLKASSYICAFPHILGSSSSNMTLRLLHSEFPSICGKFDFLFYQCNLQALN